ncbi:MAG: bifunctional proline dehydrogenase/L-glutamate gamma-semialdehyde dehydrogenase PutA [Rhizobiaceae bacterium]|nr:bifunctional proline dehydrogenase/L-glutamate gamma-semialdehyde dehydrogenase PutA [Rhizobiaceae bacterium]
MSNPLSEANSSAERAALDALLKDADINASLRERMRRRALELVVRIREDSNPGMMELFLEEYGLSSDEGIALMCLAEALLRVPDGETMDALIEDKIAPSEWGQHLGKSHSSLVNASTWALLITGAVLKDDAENPIARILQGAIKRVGEPIIRQAVTQAMKEMGRQFVLGETIEMAIERAKIKEQEGFTYSYDMLGEAALTEDDAKRYHLAYSDAINSLSAHASSADIRNNPGISIKLSALHPRYETLKRDRVMDELVPRARSLAVLAKSAGIGLNIDAEEAARLDLSLDVIEAIASDRLFKGWDGMGIVVQTYNLKAPKVLERLYNMAGQLDQRFLVRLVKGAYWDTEIKRSQVEGHKTFPVFTRKASTDVSYICCAKKLLGMTDRFYPQFATHNAHTVAAILEMAEDKSAFEFQRLHGMGEALHDTVLRRQGTKCRIYAPVGAHKDLLAYLVRRLLENGANSSFVNQIVDESVSPEEVAADPFALLEDYQQSPENPVIRQPAALFSPERENSTGWDLSDPVTLNELEDGVSAFDQHVWELAGDEDAAIEVTNPATKERIGSISFATAQDVQEAVAAVRPWTDCTPMERADVLRKAADLFEENAHETFALLMREAGKTLIDCVGELREAVDFLRYYAQQAEEINAPPAGVFTCIAPWNFPLAIYTGQIAAALAAGNGVLAKPAEATCLIANMATNLLWEAGVPDASLKFLPGTGSEVGSLLTSAHQVDGVCFTGSTETAQRINRTMAKHLDPSATLIAETGGLNAMIVDSTALPEQAVRDILASAFQSAGQRCSALRVLYLQKDIAEDFQTMLFGAMDELKVGDPRDFSTDIGPIINEEAASKIRKHIDTASADGRLLKSIGTPEYPCFIAPTVIAVNSIADLEEEIFGPVLHIATFESQELDTVIDEINAKGYGLTFGLHSRIDDRVQHVIDRLEVGNIYVNRNQIGAVVGSQPFGGEGLSGTGPKAGGPQYLQRFLNSEKPSVEAQPEARPITARQINEAFSSIDAPSALQPPPVELPGPTGESNQYSVVPRGNVLCLGPGRLAAEQQAQTARRLGCKALAVASGVSDGIDGGIDPKALLLIEKLDAVVDWSPDQRELRETLAARSGRIVPLLNDANYEKWLVAERHVCIDTTAAGGNTALLES